MIAILPLTPSDPHYGFSTTLADRDFAFEVRWNSRDGAWYLDMYDADGVQMFAGEKLVLGTYIGRKSAHPWFSKNVLTLVDTTIDERDPGLDDLGSRVLLLHFPETDLLNEFAAV